MKIWNSLLFLHTGFYFIQIIPHAGEEERMEGRGEGRRGEKEGGGDGRRGEKEGGGEGRRGKEGEGRKTERGERRRGGRKERGRKKRGKEREGEGTRGKEKREESGEWRGEKTVGPDLPSLSEMQADVDDGSKGFETASQLRLCGFLGDAPHVNDSPLFDFAVPLAFLELPAGMAGQR